MDRKFVAMISGREPDTARNAGGRRRCGLVVNPIAGMGGRVGLKGTDGPIVLAEARRRGARPLSGERAARALHRLRRTRPDTDIVTGAGTLGEDAAIAAGLPVEIAAAAESRPDGVTTAGDTEVLADALVAQGVALIMIAGGDGTVRDVHKKVGDRVPLLGIPTGVKMHSALFATSPELAGDAAAHFLSGSPRAVLRDAEIMDIDEEAARRDRVSARLYGYARSPFERALIQGPKSGAALADHDALSASAREITRDMAPGTVYILGPGTTTRLVAQILGVEKTLLGVDAILDGRLVGNDLTESGILALIADRPARIVVGIVGGQGFVFGRGNQQISAAVIRRVGRENIIVLAGMDKLARLSAERLFVDTGDPETDRALAGHMQVHTGPGRRAVMRVCA